MNKWYVLMRLSDGKFKTTLGGYDRAWTLDLRRARLYRSPAHAYASAPKARGMYKTRDTKKHLEEHFEVLEVEVRLVETTPD